MAKCGHTGTYDIHVECQSLLRQVGLLPSDASKLPLSKVRPAHAEIVPLLQGHQIAARFIDETAPANPLLELLPGREASAVKGRDAVGKLLGGTQEQESVRPSTRLNSKFVGGKSTVFSDEPVETVPKVHVDPRRYESHFVLSQEQLTPNSLLAKTTKVEDSDDMKLGKQISRDPRTNVSHFSLAHDVTPHLQELHLGRKPGNVRHNASQLDETWNSTGTLNEESIVEDKQNKPKPPSIWESSSNGEGVIQSRPSSR